MSVRPIESQPTPSLLNPLWFSFDPTEEDKDIWLLEQEITAEAERVEQKHCDLFPIGKSANDSYVDEEDEEDEEEDDNDDEESESHEDDDDDEIDMEVDDQDSATF